MSTAGPYEGIRRAWSSVRLAVRYLTAVVLATIAGGVVWLITETLFEEAGFEAVDFARELALAVGVEGSRQRVGLAGLGLTLAAFLAIVLIHAAVVQPLLGRRERDGARVGFAARVGPAFALTLLAGGFVAAPIMGLGVLGLSDGVSTSIALVVAAAAASIALVRVYSLVISPRWWEEKDEGVQHAFAEGPPRGSFELAEEGREEGGEGPGREADPTRR